MTIRFGLKTDSLCDSISGTSDSQFLAAVEWRDSRPGIAQEISEGSDLKTIGMCWKQQCKGWDTKNGSLFSVLSIWQDAIPAALRSCRGEFAGDSAQFTKRRNVDDTTANRLAAYVEQNSVELNADPIALLACIELLCSATRQLPAQTIGQLWRAVLSAAVAQADSFQEALAYDWRDASVENLENRPLLLASGLLPWVCGVLFDEVKGAPKLAKSGRQGVAEQLTALTDKDGCLHESTMRRASVLLALWRDATVFGNVFGQRLWKADAARLFGKFLARASALLRVDGRLAVEHNSANDAGNLALLGETVGASSKLWAKSACAIFKAAALSLTTTKRKPKKLVSALAAYKKNAPASWQSDDAKTSCLRATWAPDSPIVSVTHATATPTLELAIDGVPLLKGDWHVDLAENHEYLPFNESFDCCCWYTDREVDYCEIELKFEGGPEVSRHIMLHRTGQYAVISDVVMSSKADRIDLETQLPLAPGVSIQNVPRTREQQLHVGGKVARIYPLVLPQDSGIGTAGTVSESTEYGRALRIAQASVTGGVFSPVVIDWNEDRRAADAEWVPLTVTEAGEVDRTGGAGFRLHVGNLHLVLYRALRKTERYRTVLGIQTGHETIIGEFTNKGVVRELLIVQ